MWVFHKFTTAFPHATGFNHPPISSPAGSEVALPKAGVDFTSFVSFSSSKPSEDEKVSRRFFRFFLQKSRELTMTMNSFETYTWQLLVDLIQKIRENKGYNSKIRYVTVVWGAIRRILYINYIKFQSVIKSSISNWKSSYQWNNIYLPCKQVSTARESKASSFSVQKHPNMAELNPWLVTTIQTTSRWWLW